MPHGKRFCVSIPVLIQVIFTGGLWYFFHVEYSLFFIVPINQSTLNSGPVMGTWTLPSGWNLSSCQHPENPQIVWPWWRHQMETSSALLALCAGIHRSPVNITHKGQWRRALMFSLIWPFNKWFSKQSWGWWFETPSRSLWHHCNANHYWRPLCLRMLI